MSWNRTYRPAQVSDLHLDFVRTQIQRMMDAGKIPQALLFAGPKGTGKTSTSRIIGAVVNDPKNEKIVDSAYFKGQKSKSKLNEPDITNEFAKKIFEGTSFVVQEMDAASNRGIDDIRQLKTRASMPPQDGKMSVFILDEAHMLTTEAFNALLKLLEEPPQHAIFILATTELHKIPATIVSRCQMVEFKKATTHEITNRLKSILLSEKIKFDEDALELIANHADGSFRDAIKILELTAQSGKITSKEVSVYTSISVSKEVEQLLKHLLNKDEQAVVNLFEDLREKSINQQYFHKSLLEVLHLSLMQNLQIKAGSSMINRAVAQFLLQNLSDSDLSSASPIPHLKLELKILELIDRSKNKSGAGTKKVNNSQNKSNKTQSAKKSSQNNNISIYDQDIPLPEEEIQSTIIQSKSYEEDFKNQVNRTNKQQETIGIPSLAEFTGDPTLLKEQWHTFIDNLTLTHSTLASLLRSAKLVDTGSNKATIGVYYTFHQEQLSQPKSNLAIQTCIKDLLGGFIELEFVLVEAPKKAELIEVQHKDRLIETASQALM